MLILRSTESWAGQPRCRCRRVASGASPQSRVVLGLTHMAVVMDPLSLSRMISCMLWRCLGAEARGTRLLKNNLSAAQLQQFKQHRHFDVIGGQTGKRYRIRPGTSLNIDECDAEGRKVTSWCFVPEGHLATGDVMLAQKFALELFEDDTLAIAGGLRGPSRGSFRH